MSASVPAVTPGNTRVPLSTVLDQLRGRLTTPEIDAVITAIIPARQVGVQPGDLITSALFNQLLDDIADLQSRVATLEGDKGVPVLSGRAPTGDVALMSLLTIFGTSFDPTPSNNIVQLGGVAINAFVGTENSTTQLSFQIPNTYTGLPKVVDLTLTRDGRISNALEIRLVPQVQRAAGPMVVIPRTVAQPAIVAGTTFTLQWLVNPQVSDTYSYSLLFFDTGGLTADSWGQTARIAPQSPRPVATGSPLLVAATMTAPAGFSRTQIALEVVSSDGTKARTSDPMLFTANFPPAVSDVRALVTVSTARITPTDATGAPNPLRTARVETGGVTLDGLQIRFGATVDVPIDVFATGVADAAGDYTYTAIIDMASDDLGAWTVGAITPPSNTGVPQAQTRQITVRLTNNDPARKNSVSYLIVNAVHAVVGNPTLTFTSFARIPIQGVAS